MKKNKNVIEFRNVTKTYKLFKDEKQRIWSVLFKKANYKERKVIKGINFDIKKGESVALLGKNGAGKSTILKMITEVVYPTSGTIKVKGRVSALLELTTGFDKEFTGRQNIYLKGNILGMEDSEIKKIENKIIEFAGLEEYIDQPVRMYSSGMKARLGFSLNVNIDPDILIIDEALSVGDKAFKNKCLKKVKQLMSEGEVTILFVTHSTKTAEEFCERGIVLENGYVKFDGEIKKAIEVYDQI